MRQPLTSAVAALTACLALASCGYAVTAGHPTPDTSQAANRIDVQSLWKQAVERCNSDRVGTTPPADPNNFGVAAAWPTDAAVSQVIATLHPTGDAEFTEDRLVDLQAALLGTRFKMANTVVRGNREIELAPQYGLDSQPSVDAVRRDVSDLGSAWRLEHDFLAQEVNGGVTSKPAGETAAAMEQVAATRRSACR